MHAIVSILDEPHYTWVEDLWRDLEFECGLTGVTATPLPHFSWHIAAQYDFSRLEAGLSQLTAEADPFVVRTSGLGLFTGPAPVIYIPVIKDLVLAKFHQHLWGRVHPTAIATTQHYAPETWVPHITMAYGDVDQIKLGCAMKKLAFQYFNWEIRVDHLALVYQYSGQVGKIQARFPFGGLVRTQIEADQME